MPKATPRMAFADKTATSSPADYASRRANFRLPLAGVTIGIKHGSDGDARTGSAGRAR